MPVLYGTADSPACRAVYMTADALGIALEKKQVSLDKEEHMKPEYLKINPLHTVPSLDENGTIIVDSHAINTYLVGKYGNDDALYPKDLIKRAAVDSMLYFDTGLAFAALKIIYRSYLFHGQKGDLTEFQKQQILDIYNYVNLSLTNNKWLTGDSVTLADISLLSTISSLNTMLAFDEEKMPHIRRWLQDAEKLPYYVAHKPGLEAYRESWKWVISQ